MLKWRNMSLSVIFACLALFHTACSDHSPTKNQTPSMEQSFHIFLQKYWDEVKNRNTVYLKSVHPELPDEMQDFFFDATLQMMAYSEEKQLDRPIDCNDLNICKVTYPQADGGWAAQQFIFHDGVWRWLPQG